MSFCLKIFYPKKITSVELISQLTRIGTKDHNSFLCKIPLSCFFFSLKLDRLDQCSNNLATAHIPPIWSQPPSIPHDVKQKHQWINAWVWGYIKLKLRRFYLQRGLQLPGKGSLSKMGAPHQLGCLVQTKTNW